MTLYLEKRGCNFYKGDQLNELSDIGNHRVCVDGIKAKNGRTYFLEFMHLPSKSILTLDTCYENKEGSWRDLSLEATINALYIPFTKQSILDVVNEISVDVYDSIVWSESFEFIQEKGANFVPAWKMVEWVKKDHIDYEESADGTVVKLYTGDYVYDRYDIKELDNGKEKVTIILKEK